MGPSFGAPADPPPSPPCPQHNALPPLFALTQISSFSLYRYKKHLPCSIALLGTSWVTHTHTSQAAFRGRTCF